MKRMQQAQDEILMISSELARMGVHQELLRVFSFVAPEPMVEKKEKKILTFSSLSEQL